ncbi:23S rRNA (uracil(1939)-C(5))-methyltransferase RlmD [Clostridium senegalense]|uniref:23S rRNA (Uracil(1939)-C(5))-methyltransferase RlmD n=1 Tax=Clostridium senegalense TaxID=1465809 RepID=A0A6M0H6Y3_9CLOT|nr:23S rRNA (uracil(1939)-C(5))-methyltransferase RlmD [Clostridium senegalense]NEU05601.1 23S rRNA (uracil(1939)-C(5))-methyltransferase RlmD [Clostridium senegalense]
MGKNNILNCTVEKNKEYIIKIENSGHQGEGVGKIDNFTVFVEGALKDETVKIKLIKINKNYGVGKLIEVLSSSESRTEPVCSTYKRCGGCNLQHSTYEAQLSFKTERVRDVIKRIGKLEDVKIHNTIGMENPYNYRNKVQLPVGKNKDGEVVVGFYAPRSHDIINMECCYIQDEVGDKVIKVVKEWIKKFNIETYDEKTNSGIVRHIMIRKGFKTEEVMVVVVTNGNSIPYSEELVSMLKDNIEGIDSIIQNINNKQTNVILGQKCKTLYGKDTITDFIGEFKFNISPLSFFQVNSIQTEVLYNKALEYADLQGDEIVFDAYCGTGTISLFLSQNAKKVYGVEIIPQAIQNAIKNAEENNVTNTEFIVGEAENEIPKLIEKGIKADVVVVDPPRKGCEESLLHSIAKMSPKKIVYVSCDPATLARDLNILQQLGYKTLEIQPVDMFPQTAHVETVVKLEKAKLVNL